MTKLVSFVWPNACNIPASTLSLLRTMIAQEAQDGELLRLEYGPIIRVGEGHLFAHHGTVDEHVDEAGYTYGLVLLADGTRHLEIEDKRWPLPTGSLFLLDSDQMHSSPVDDNSLLVFVTKDFDHMPGSRFQPALPDQTLESFATNILTHLAAAIRDRLKLQQQRNRK